MKSDRFGTLLGQHLLTGQQRQYAKLQAIGTILLELHFAHLRVVADRSEEPTIN